MVSDIKTTSVRLSWFPPDYSGNSPITSYKIEAKKGSNNWQLARDDINPSDRQMSVIVRSLSPHTQYQFRVRAVNQVGDGAPSGASGVIRTLISGNRIWPVLSSLFWGNHPLDLLVSSILTVKRKPWKLYKSCSIYRLHPIVMVITRKDQNFCKPRSLLSFFQRRLQLHKASVELQQALILYSCSGKWVSSACLHT